MMDSFIDSTEVIRMKQRYDRLLMTDSSISGGNTRHNLLQDFEETPVKSLKLADSRSIKRSFADISVTVDDATENSALRKQLTSRDADIITLKAAISQMETRLASMEKSACEARINYDKQVMTIKAKKDREVTKTAEMKSKLNYVMEREKIAREELKRLEEELQHQKLELEDRLLVIQQEKFDVADRAQQAKSDWLELESELRSQIMSQMHEISELETKFSEAQAQQDIWKKAQAENAEHCREIEKLRVELQEEQRKNKDLLRELSDHQDNLLITKALKNDLDLVPSMKSELEKLRMDNEHLRSNEQNTILLEENVLGLKRKLEFLSPTQERLAKLEIENEELQGRLHRWEAADTSGSRRPQSPSSLVRRVQELETNQAQMMLSEGELQSNLNSLQYKLDRALDENIRLQAELTAEKSIGTQSNDVMKQLRRKLLLVTRERDSYKALLDTYESEVTVNFDAEKRTQIQNLESILQSYKDHCSELETEMGTLREKLGGAQAKSYQHQLQTPMSASQQTSSKEDQELIRQFRERISELEVNLMTIREEKDILEARIEQRDLQGDYDPSKTKVIHLTMNPSARAQKAHQEELVKLKEENEKLRKRNQILESHGGGQVEDLTLMVQEKLQQPSPSKEIEDMKAQLVREEMRNKRLMEVFKKTSQEFREICYQLTGYKIDIPCSNQYRLTSMYAESQRDYFLFQQNSQGEIQMLQTDFSMMFQEAMETLLQTQNSIPMFLSHVTMELFGRQTLPLG